MCFPFSNGCALRCSGPHTRYTGRASEYSPGRKVRVNLSQAGRKDCHRLIFSSPSPGLPMADSYLWSGGESVFKAEMNGSPHPRKGGKFPLQSLCPCSRRTLQSVFPRDSVGMWLSSCVLDGWVTAGATKARRPPADNLRRTLCSISCCAASTTCGTACREDAVSDTKPLQPPQLPALALESLSLSLISLTFPLSKSICF